MNTTQNRYDPTEDLKKYQYDFDWSQHGAVKNAIGNWVWWNEKDEWHNENGPAYINKGGCIEWHINGNCHRDDGPAWVWLDGRRQYWIHGEHVTEEEYWQWYDEQKNKK